MHSTCLETIQQITNALSSMYVNVQHSTPAFADQDQLSAESNVAARCRSPAGVLHAACTSSPCNNTAHTTSKKFQGCAATITIHQEGAWVQNPSDPRCISHHPVPTIPARCYCYGPAQPHNTGMPAAAQAADAWYTRPEPSVWQLQVKEQMNSR